MLFIDRIDAGKRLARILRLYGDRPNVIVLALPRGGVPVAAEIAKAIAVPLDVLVVRKLGVPGSEETAMGAIASRGFQFLNRDLIWQLGITPDAVDTVVQREQREMARRETSYRDGLPPLNVRDRTVILVDDGLATGATMRVAIQAVRAQKPRELTVAVPVAAKAVCQEIGSEVDHIVCAEMPQPFYAVGLWYEEFGQTSDDEVRSLLWAARQRAMETAMEHAHPGRA